MKITKSTNFERVSTEINEELDSECDIDINVETIADNEKSKISKKKLVITLIGILFFLVTTAIVFGVLFGILGLHKTTNPNRPKSSIEKCDNLRCCKFKSLEMEGAIDCPSLQIEECVLNDEVCDWNCDVSTPSSLHRTFLRFDPGIGQMHDDEVNDDDITDEDEVTSVEDYLQQSKMLSYSECGDVYEVDEDYIIAKQRFNDTSSFHASNGPNEDADTRRRLIITDPDNRIQSSIKDTTPYKSVGILVTNIGSCTGTLISRRVIITAAECIYDRSSGSFVYGWKFYPDAVSSSASTYFSWSGAYIPLKYVLLKTGSELYNWGLIRLSTTNTYKDWIQIGSNTGLSAPLPIHGISYPHDKPLNTRWVQSCSMDYVGSQYMRSADCDAYVGQNGEAMYESATDSAGAPTRIIYAVFIGHSSSQIVNYYARIDASKWKTICDYISSGEASICSS